MGEIGAGIGAASGTVYVVAGYAVTAMGLGAYVAALAARARRARGRAAAIAAKRGR